MIKAAANYVDLVTITKTGDKNYCQIFTPPHHGESNDRQKADAVDRAGDAGGSSLMMQDTTGLKQKWSGSPPAPTVCLLRFHCVILRL